MRTATIALTAIALAGCPRPVGPSPVSPEPAPPPAVTIDCVRACANIVALGCQAETRTSGGESCANVCTRAVELRPLPLACWATAPSVDALRACGAIRCL